jgi:glycosyltransferase involved in cell wall biosynthesis
VEPEGRDTSPARPMKLKRGRAVLSGRTDAGVPPAVSVVVPIYNEEENIGLLHQRLSEALGALKRSYEIVYVDDGSRDRSFERLCGVTAADPHSRIVRFRRNFGQTAALQAGIEESRGEILVFLDGDLQNDPADIGSLLARIDEGYDVVSGWRKDRHDPWLSRRLPSMIANWLISRVTGVVLRDYGCTLKAYRAEVIRPVKLYGEMHRFIPALVSWSGATVTEVPVRHEPRRFGKSKYGISRTARVVFDLITVKFLGSYSTKPIYVFGFAGLIFWLLAFLSGAIVIVERLLPPYPQAHNNPLLLLAVFLATLGVQSIMLGLLAELLIRTYHESQGKPTYVVRQVVQGGATSGVVGTPADWPDLLPAGSAKSDR